MPKINKYENKIPAFYRRKTLELLLFAHVTALVEQCDMALEPAVRNFLDLYGIDEDDYPIGSALKIYHRTRNNFIWSNIKKNL